jgi:hypothetical protein
MKSFVDRMIVGLEACPYTKNKNIAPTGLEERDIQAAPIGYRSARSGDVCVVIAAFWNCICELLSVPDEQLSCTVFTFPAEAHDRFSAVAELLSRSLFMYRGEDLFEVLYMHPSYDRNLIIPEDKPAHGHLPPTSWLGPMLRLNGNVEADRLSDEEKDLQNYQRRSPLPALIIKRKSQLDVAASPESGIVSLDMGGGSIEMASGVPIYARNVIRLAAEGKDSLQAALYAEIAITL